MKQGENNYAYIDGNNLYRGVSDAGWKIDFFRFRRWLADKYDVSKAYYFIGLIPRQKDLYKALQEAGYTLDSGNQRWRLRLLSEASFGKRQIKGHIIAQFKQEVLDLPQKNQGAHNLS